MDDHISRQQLDELAELYLTNALSPSDDEADAPSPVEGPAPIKLAPKTGNTPSSSPELDDDDPFGIQDDSHPVLRLTDSDVADAQDESAALADPQPIATQEPEPSAPLPAPKAIFEAVLLGNLPGMSGPWLTQYAQLLAQTDGPVALLHVSSDAIDMELVEPRPEAEPAPAQQTLPVRIPPMRGNMTGLVGLLDAMVRSDTTPARTVLIRIDASTDAQTLSRLTALEDWTVLCGSDDASIASAGHQVRTMVRADPRLADRNVGLMIMGSDETTAHQAASRIADDLEHDLAQPVELIGHLKRMQPVQVREIGSFPDPVAIWPQLVNWLDTVEPPEQAPLPDIVASTPAPQPTPQAPKPTARSTAPTAITPKPSEPLRPQRLSPEAAKLAAPSTPTSRPEPRPTFQPTVAPPTPARQTARRPEPAATPPKPQPAAARPKPQPTSARPTQTRASEPTRPAPQPRVLAAQPELDLIALLAQGPAALDNPAALDARIPDQPLTQLAVDAQGVVHILLKKGTVPFNDADATSTDPRDAVLQLIEAGRWVREHLELLALTQRDATFVDQEPTLHLLTDRADLTAHLVAKLAGQVKLHLLQQVQLGKETGWFCTPLG